MSQMPRWSAEELAAYQQRQRSAGAGATSRDGATPEGRNVAPAPAVLDVIGIDPGVTTGFAVWSVDAMKLLRVESMGIVRAMREVAAIARAHADGQLFVIFEDARKRRRFDVADREEQGYRAGARREGVGSVKRDSSIWEEFLLDIGVPFKARAPMSTKWSAERFRRATKWEARTNEHGRDAAMIVQGLNRPMVLSMIEHYKLAIAAGEPP